MASIDEVTKTRFLNDKYRLVLNLMYTANYIRSTSEDMLKPYGLTNPQFNIPTHTTWCKRLENNGRGKRVDGRKVAQYYPISRQTIEERVDTKRT